MDNILTLEKHGYQLEHKWQHNNNHLSSIYIKDDEAFIIDYDAIFECNFPYASYCQNQNEIMNQYRSVYRILHDDTNALEDIMNHKEIYLDTKTFNREASSIDPSPLEYIFENCFSEAYGEKEFKKLHREWSYLLLDGSTGYIDYALFHKDKTWLAIEANGISYHHPYIIKKEKYQRILLKQNSVVLQKGKLFRWDTESMTHKARIVDEIREYIGEINNYCESNNLLENRKFKLYDHQMDYLTKLKEDRKMGTQSSLIVLPTGTGKTQIAVEDLNTFDNLTQKMSVLVLVPQIENRIHWQKEFKLQLSSQLIYQVETYASMGRNYINYSPTTFDYIIIDEAHHAVAPVLKKVIQHFRPNFLLGMTATDKRLDNQRLEAVFGSYETTLTLEEAVRKGILCPIHGYRLNTNIDLSKVKFNGKEYNNSQLEKNVVVPSRNELVADLLYRDFYEPHAPKSGLVFCVNVKHAETMAKLLKKKGFHAESVHGKDKKRVDKIESYMRGETQFLCTCSLLTEGWDAPRTSIIVMARPTLSKVLYTQQIGRGTRIYPNKEALYVIDVVDEYGNSGSFSNCPWSLHALFDTLDYKPYANILTGDPSLAFIDTINEKLISLDKFNVFTYEKLFGDYYSIEQAARELFINTGTFRNWIKKGQVTPDESPLLNNTRIHLFTKDTIEQIRRDKNLSVHNETTIVDDFWEFIEKGDYSFSYKMYFINALLDTVDEVGVVSVDILSKRYQELYIDRFNTGEIVDRPNSPYNRLEMLNDIKKIKRSMLVNPFEKFERKKFMYHAKDLAKIEIHHRIWDELKNRNGMIRLKNKINEDLDKYQSNLK